MDDLLDLSWAPKPTAPSVPQPPAKGSTPTSFDFLSIQPQQPRSSTPNYAPGLLPSRSSTSTPAPPPVSTPASSQAKPDAFSGLLSLGGPAASNDTKQMTIAQRQAALAEEKRKSDEAQKKKYEAESQFWDNLGSSSSTSATLTGNAGQSNASLDDLHDFLQPSIKPHASSGPSSAKSSRLPSAANSSKASQGTFWSSFDNEDLLSSSNSSGPVSRPHTGVHTPAPTLPPAISIPTTTDPFDFEVLESTMSSTKPVSAVKQAKSSEMKMPVSNYDLRDDGERDLLGGLGRSAGPLGPARPPESSPPRKPQRTHSPPPHIVGQIVEMGFSPTQARSALAKTSTGLDVQAALEILLRSPSPSHRGAPRDDMGEAEDDVVEYERIKREEAEKEKRRRRRAGPSRDSVQPRTPAERENETQSQDQAERIIAQASELGQGLFNKASVFWSQGKERALKVYEEQRKAMEAAAATDGRRDDRGGSERKADGRPKWMQDAEEWKGEDTRGAEAGGFVDSDKEDEPKHGSSRPAAARRREGAQKSAEKRPAVVTRDKDADLLFGGDDHLGSRPSSAAPASSRHKPSQPPRAPIKSSTPLPLRAIIPADPQQLQKSQNHKTKGNEHFKLGRFTEAESAYTLAISSLPEGCLFLVPLLNNRATARLKLGDFTSAAEDCTSAITIISPSYHPSKEAPLPIEYADIKLGDALTKALTKRAQAWEMGEKWKQALEDWERTMSLDSAILGGQVASTRKLAAEGARRARNMIADGQANPSAPVSRPVSKPAPGSTPVPPSRPADVNRSAAVADLRKAAQALEAEDAARSAHKDAVDAKLDAWRNGKETNIRALIASLDTVLWDEIMKGGLKVGMHELITDKQVKIKYMKVAARLHPDKLNVNNTTVEQRMLANGAFGTLSEAWQAFNQ
ncbi:hypothetical protein L202_07416 [Cryptococcus amylolentus CBS 6039]|uniref:UBA domain-containing protein n=1 Tax=Cryptococcus amylolentus CBS 6039 TaxID=1295533 RepID=A0A1E3HDS3_9TREE|nr:hypothetical protein L202_07416 [Cryptococcus amylolentus CBS 6039]ODN73906.1 hypothetical protein L202_07416 [Cryptococcus amylolentus CBS 6039]